MIFFNRLCVIIGDFDSFKVGDPVDFRLARSFVRSASTLPLNSLGAYYRFGRPSHLTASCEQIGSLSGSGVSPVGNKSLG